MHMTKTSKYEIEEYKNRIQDCNISFLIGSGCSSPYLRTLKYIEELITKTEELSSTEQIDVIEIIKASLYKKYFDKSISGNSNVLSGTDAIPAKNNELASCFKGYCDWVNTIHNILSQRKNPLLHKQVNVFTTNVDIFLEKALENCEMEFNDGFIGRFNPVFNTGNYRKSIVKTSLHFENKSEMPLFNLYKLHGSVSWTKQTNDITFDQKLDQLKNITSKELLDTEYVEIDDELDDVTKIVLEAQTKKAAVGKAKAFSSEYEKLAIVNPNKSKLRGTVLDQTHYDLLRIYSNELEKENALLFVIGFSFRDEHIRQITTRAIKSNPTLQVIIFAHSRGSMQEIEKELQKEWRGEMPQNISIVFPEQAANKDKFKYTLSDVNEKIFVKLLESLEGELIQDEQEQ